jgi:hypothetical protein
VLEPVERQMQDLMRENESLRKQLAQVGASNRER